MARNWRDVRVEGVLNLEPTPNIMPATNWLDAAKLKLQEHFNHRFGSFPVYDRAVVINR